MTFIQNQEITTPENVGYITELTANYCYKGLSHNALGPTGVNLFMSCSLPDLNMFLQTLLCVMVTYSSLLQCVTLDLSASEMDVR